MRILLVEPDLHTQRKLIDAIKTFETSLVIDVARSAYDASSKLRFGRYDLIISEIYLPDLRADVMISFVKNDSFKIGITGDITSEDIRRSFDEVILKPVSQDDLRLSFINARMKSSMVGSF